MSQNTTIVGENWELWQGKIVPRSLLPGYVVLSFVVSVIGSWTTLELINRRTSSRGLYNWSLLLTASISMGGIAIWCMHFIGNRAIVLGSGEIELQIAYSAAFTAISFFLPVVVLFMAFAAVGSNEQVSFVRLGLGGALAGLGICGMHYVGQAGIINYDCSYFIAYIVGAALIAVVACITALGIFFVFRSAWNNALWKRGLCALILAGAVSGMHWVGSVGTRYRLKHESSPPSTTSRNATTISVIVLSIGGSLILLGLSLVAQVYKLRIANRAQHLTLATAIFDKKGKLLVTSDGLLPTKKITDSYRERSFDDVFSITHPAFGWIYRTSRNWAGISVLIPGMRDHLHRAGLRSRNRFGTENDGKFRNDEGTPVSDYSIIFRELFCAAAAELAEDLNQPIENLGILFDEIIAAGKKPQRGNAKKSAADVELGGPGRETMGRGQLLFLVRVADRREAEQLQAAGYRFAAIPNVLAINAEVLQVTRENLTREFSIMEEYATDPHILDPGVHLALFAVRASMGQGFDVLARKDARNLLPTMQLPFDSLEKWQVDYLKALEGFTVAACMKQLNKTSKSKDSTPKEKLFAGQVLSTLEALKDEIDDPFFNDAMLIGKPIEAPCRGPTVDSPPGVCKLIVFRLMIPIHSRPPGKKLDFTKLTFFQMQQQIYKNSKEHAYFARRNYREFAPVLKLSGRLSESKPAGSTVLGIPTGSPTPRASRGRKKSKLIFWASGSHEDSIKIRGDNSSEKNLVDGIVVSQEVSVDVSEERPTSPRNDDGKKTGGGIEMAPLRKEPTVGVVSSVSQGDEETPSFVDELFKITIDSRAH